MTTPGLKTGRSEPLTDDQLRASAVPVSMASTPLPSGAAQDGTDITTPTAMPAGGAGIRGWLSAIWTKLNAFIPIKLLDESGNAYGVKHIQYKPRVSAMPYLYDVGEGNVPDHTLFDKYAINDDIDSANEEDIWSVGGLYSWPAAAVLMAAVSSSAEDDPAKADTSAGTGIWSVRVYYLDTLFAEKTADVTLNGTVEVNIAATDIYRINRIRPLTMGTGLKAAGNIDIKARAAGTTIYSRMATGTTKGRQLVYTVPAGKSLYLVQWSGSVGGTSAPKYGKFTLRSTYDSVSGARNAWMTAYAEHGASSAGFERNLPGPLYFPAGSDIIMSCKTLDDNCYVTGAIRGWIE